MNANWWSQAVLLVALQVVMPGFLLCSCEGEGLGDGGVEPWSCEGEDVWEDPVTGLCWMREDARIEVSENDYQDIYYMNWWDARDLCSGLLWSGYDDWRLPEIQELIDIIRGCQSAQCPVNDPECLDFDCNDTQVCSGCENRLGPGAEGCYWPYELGPECGSTWWSTSTVSSYGDLAWCLSFSVASVYPWNRNYNRFLVRCVRGG